MALRDTVLGRDAACQHRRIGKYCPDCGMLLDLPRYSFGEMTKGTTVLWMEKGFRRTLLGLFHHPGRAIRTFLFEDRNHLIKPMAYLLLAIAFNLGVQGLLSESAACAADDGLCLMFKEDPVTPKLVEVGTFALIYRLAFRRSGLNLWEYGVGFGYIVAQSFILSALLSLAFVSLPELLRDTIAFFGSSFYIITATIMLLGIRGLWRRMGAVALGVLGLILFMMVLIGMGEIWILEPPAA